MIDRGEPRKLNVNIKISSSNTIKVLVFFYSFRNNTRMSNYYLMIAPMLKKQKSISMIQENQILRNPHKLLRTSLLRVYNCVMNTLISLNVKRSHNDLYNQYYIKYPI